MARARNLKPGLFKNEILGAADPLYTLLFEGLWLLADRAGRLEDRPLRIKGEVFPYRDNINIDEMLNWLQRHGFILRYEAEGKKCIVVLEFVKHQNPHRNEAESVLPSHEAAQPISAPAQEESEAIPPMAEALEKKTEGIASASDFSGTTRADSLFTDSLYSDSLIPDSLNSVAIATGGAAATRAADLTKDELWRAGKSLLEQAGLPKEQCGSFVGKLVKDYGDKVVVEAVRTAVVVRPADPIEYLKATCMRTVGQRAAVNKQEALEQRNRSVADAWAAEGARHATV